MPRALADTLRTAVETGDWTDLRERLAPGAVLHTSNEAGRRDVAGADAVGAQLSGPGRGEIRDWDAREWPAGVALSALMTKVIRKHRTLRPRRLASEPAPQLT